MILGLDTATAGTAVAVWAPDGPAIERRDDPPPGARPAHAGKLLVLVEEALAAAGAGWDDVERIAVGCDVWLASFQAAKSRTCG